VGNHNPEAAIFLWQEAEIEPQALSLLRVSQI
jgi:hypothetical protein